MGFQLNEWHIRGALVLLGIFSLTALVLSLVGIHNFTQPVGNRYGLVFDAGSSHTSLFVYQWPAEKENDTGVVSQTLSCHVNASGISSFSSNPPEAGESLRGCLDEAMLAIPPKLRRETPAYLGATAGMRLLRSANKSLSDQVLEAVAKTIQQYPVSFRGAQIITGEAEGAYGWITINYLLDSFTEYSAKEQEWIHPSPANIRGALDLGGASTQISFIPAGHIADPNEAAQFRLYGFDYTIYTHSYLCYGQNQALQQVIALLIVRTMRTAQAGGIAANLFVWIHGGLGFWELKSKNIWSAKVHRHSSKNSSTSQEVTHPCYPTGYQQRVTAEEIFSSPCTKHLDLAGTTSRNVTLVGASNATLCREAIKKIFNFSNCSYNDSCGFNGIYQPPVHGKFLAFSAYYYTFNFLNLTEVSTLDTVNDSIHAFCARAWPELNSSYPGENKSRLRNYCASANYILTLLLDGYGFSKDTWGNIAFRMEVANSDIGWSLGYMLNLTNMIPSENPQRLQGHEEAVWVASVVFIALSLAVCIILAIIHFLR